ncbi:hypothetical protein EON63_05540 [archaeon]|nr:MAG: hypothetical protein EON63_05540 [archaeon]
MHRHWHMHIHTHKLMPIFLHMNTRIRIHTYLIYTYAHTNKCPCSNIYIYTQIPARSLMAFSRVQNQVSKGACLAFPTHHKQQNEGTSCVGEGEEKIGVQILTFNFRGVKEH